MAWVSKDDVRGAAHGHFLFSVLLMAFFGVGYHHTRATDFDGAVPYWVFGAVGGGVVSCQFVQCKRNEKTRTIIDQP